MSCANCSAAVGSALTGTPGVVDASVNVATDEAIVRYNPETAGRGALYDAVEDAGYDPVREDDGSEPEAELTAADEQRRLVLFGLAFAVPLLVVGMGNSLLPGVVPDAVFGTTRTRTARSSTTAARTWTYW